MGNMEDNDKTSNIDSQLAGRVLKNRVLLYAIVFRLPLFVMTKRNCVINAYPSTYFDNLKWIKNEEEEDDEEEEQRAVENGVDKKEKEKEKEKQEKQEKEDDVNLYRELRLVKDIHFISPINSFCWSRKKVRYISGGFIVRFDFKMGKHPLKYNDGPPADGFAFVIHNDPRGTDTVSRLYYGGSGLGYSGITASIAVEFDDFKYNDDPNDNHIAIHTNGTDLNNSEQKYALTYASPSFKLCDFKYHQVEIIYEPIGQQLTVIVDHDEVINHNIDINDTIGIGEDDSAFVGFTSACGEFTQNVFIKNCSIYRY
ncbi:hypothetical protein PPL_02297 [Heterostelium album PN500]|uniref:Legume lectin domain-containing protein n=1 Tax=Heterostelium pallidum (strain ATCC 26659 / Pp 5 / PN500) TaxID=670386 RepID=D3B1X2_HETP5|nr:hypothetical protein PPL_02297 [Heterostelium album PN500]EFA85296.1 hypothetical protein PPL_02297 [Heterostelium album PN500]|eukprot:XP_020437405.1 hypothetical protein PPL_02297 [Heterostelium album PN500]